MGYTPRLLLLLLCLSFATPALAMPFDSPARDDRFLAAFATPLLQLDYKSAEPVLSPISYPVAAVDVRSFEQADWRPNLSLRAGVELKNGLLAGTRVQLLAEYFNGRSPNGHFFEWTVEYAGLGVRLLF